MCCTGQKKEAQGKEQQQQQQAARNMSNHLDMLQQQQQQQQQQQFDEVRHICLVPGYQSCALSFCVVAAQLRKAFPNAAVFAVPCTINRAANTEQLVDSVDKACLKHYGSRWRQPTVFVGQSMGGLAVMNLASRGWRVQAAVAVASPLNGCKTAQHVCGFFEKLKGGSAWLRRHFAPVPYLAEPKRQERPDHPFWTISFGIFNTNFDGKVMQHEAVLDPAMHTHVPFMAHEAGFLHPRCGDAIANAIKQCTNAVHSNQRQQPSFGILDFEIDVPLERINCSATSSSSSSLPRTLSSSSVSSSFKLPLVSPQASPRTSFDDVEIDSDVEQFCLALQIVANEDNSDWHIDAANSLLDKLEARIDAACALNSEPIEWNDLRSEMALLLQTFERSGQFKPTHHGAVTRAILALGGSTFESTRMFDDL